MTRPDVHSRVAAVTPIVDQINDRRRALGLPPVLGPNVDTDALASARRRIVELEAENARLRRDLSWWKREAWAAEGTAA